MPGSRGLEVIRQTAGGEEKDAREGDTEDCECDGRDIAYENDEVPVGAVTVNSESGEIISKAYNKTRMMVDPTAHAEILAIREACKKVGNQYLNNLDLYVTLEPCPMCAHAISLARIRGLYYGATDEKSGGVENGAKIFMQSSCHFKPEIHGNIEGEQCSELLKKFFKQRR